MKQVCFSKNLNLLIESKNLKLVQISKATNIPMSTLSEWTAGRDPKVSDHLVYLCKFLNVSLDYLITGQNQQPNSLELQKEVLIHLDGSEFILKLIKIRSG